MLPKQLNILRNFLRKKEDKKLAQNDIDELQNIVDATCTARTLVNEPLSFLTAEQFSKEMEKTGKDAGFNVTVFKKKEIVS